MAHADYDCCAVCDTKMNYSHDAEAKTSICTDCLRSLHANGVMVYETDDLISWMTANDNTAKRKVQILKSVGFTECHYGNDVDDTYRDLAKGPQP